MAHKLVIIGSGPAGLTAGIYAGRAKLAPLIIEGSQPGGQLTTTTKVENWPGTVSIFGPDLMDEMRKQAQTCGATFMQDMIVKVDFTKKPFTLFFANNKTIETESVIIATGSSNKKLGCVGEAEYFSKGVSTCATCDAPFYSDKEIIIVGGGDTAMTEAEHLLKFAKKITVIQNLDALSGKDPIKDRVIASPKVEFMFNSSVKEIKGNGQNVTEVIVENLKDKTTKAVPVQGVFIAIGFNPNTKFLGDQLEIDKYGYLVLSGKTKTSVDGVFAAGDVADYVYRQAVVSAGMGCMAALDAQAYLTKNETHE